MVSLTSRAHAYADDILSGVIPANPYIKGACKRFLDDLDKANKEPDYPYWYDTEEVNKSIAFFEGLLKLKDGKYQGKPFKLLPWQVFIVSNLYGWKRKKDGYRRFRRAYIETAKGSGKSPLLAGMALKGICADGEAGAQGYVIARTSDQSLVTFSSCVSMMEQSEALRTRFQKFGGETTPWQLTYHNGGFLRRVASDGKGRHSGPMPSIVIVDEYHEHDNSAMRDMYEAGFKGRQQPLLLIITNSGISMTSACGEEHTLAKAICEGKEVNNSDSYFAMVFGVEGTDKPFEDERCWVKANPSLCVNPEDCGKEGITSIPGYDYIREEVEKAKGLPSKANVVKRLNFCRWVNASDPWIDFNTIIDNTVEALSPEDERKNKWAWMSLDLSSRFDLSAGCIAWDMGTHIEAEIKTWAPKDTLYSKSQEDAVPYEQWEQEGYLEATPGEVIDYEFIVHWVKQLHSKYRLAGLAYDPFRFRDLEMMLDNYGVEVSRQPSGSGLFIIPHPQGFVAGSTAAKHLYQDEDKGFRLWMNRSIDNTEEQLRKRNVRIKYNPLLNQAFSGAVVITDASGNRRITKTQSLTRIDPAIAFLQAIGPLVQARTDELWRPVEDINQLVGVW